MDINERRRQITEILSVPGYVTVEDLAQKLNVSSVTIRSDLTALEKTGALVRTHGGAMSAEKKSTARLLSETMTEYGTEEGHRRQGRGIHHRRKHHNRGFRIYDSTSS